ncbi:MAG: hypothetical protein ACE5FL_01385 [Myxococcota bacterium]
MSAVRLAVSRALPLKSMPALKDAAPPMRPPGTIVTPPAGTDRLVPKPLESVKPLSKCQYPTAAA